MSEAEWLFGVLGGGGRSYEEKAARDYMWEVRQNVLGPLNEEAARMGVEPIPMQRAGDRPGIARAGRNIGQIFGGAPPEPEGFASGYSIAEIEGHLDRLEYTPERKAQFLDSLSLDQILALRHERPRAYVANPLVRRVHTMTAEEQEHARLFALGIETDPPVEREGFGAGTAVFQGDEREPSYIVPYKPDKPERPKLAGRWIDTSKELGDEGYYVSGTVRQVADMHNQFPGRYIPAPTQQEVTTRDIGPTTAQDIEKDTVALMGLRDQLNFIKDVFNPGWLTWGGRIQGWLLEKEAMLGILSPEERADLFDRTVGKAAAASTMNAGIKAITGAQMSEPEAKRLRLELLDAENDNPVEFMAKLMRGVYFTNLSIARNRYILSEGLATADELLKDKSWEKHMTLNGFRDFLMAEGQRVYESLAAEMGEDAAIAESSKRISQQWGVDPQLLSDQWIRENLGNTTLQGLNSLEAEQKTREAAEAAAAVGRMGQEPTR